MPLLHDSAVHASLLKRLDDLRPDSRGRWGRMSVDQMLWHVNAALEAARSIHDFNDELTRCRRLIAELVARPLTSLDTDHPVLGRLTGPAQSQLHAKHLDHHLRQFGV
jgi:hypothetical protein